MTDTDLMQRLRFVEALARIARQPLGPFEPAGLAAGRWQPPPCPGWPEH